MASSLAEDLVCPICLSLFQEPQMLGCGHHFCLSCVKSCLPEGRSKGNCPECRAPFKLPELKRHRVLANLADKARELKLDQELSPRATQAGICEDHEEPLKLFCRQDCVPICVICRDLPQHRGHEFLPTKNAVEYAQGTLKPYQKSLEKQLKEASMEESHQQEEIEELESYNADILNHISIKFEALHQILHEKEKNIKMTVQRMRANNLKEMEGALTFLKEEVSSHTEITAKIKAALETTDHVAFLKGFRELLDEVIDHVEEEEGDDDTASEEDQEYDEEQDESSKEVDEEEEDEISGDEELYTNKTNVVPVFPALKKFKESLDFEAWGEMLEWIKPRQVN
ncbi:nuclear factor 7, brain-like [Rhineura floridana]|uniref:nuclear factor 7, brain-like n=1 Tax=Rhineura floridana TaxID=261503 RepID=UPI002AC867B0|nr:nuclear factor 7, brain-like [Rhineura floridana]